MDFQEIVVMVYKVILVFSVLLFLSTDLYSQDCGTKLTVQKNRSFKSVSTEGAVFTLVLSNKGNSKANFDLSSKLLSQACGNGKQLSKNPNAEVTVSFLDNTLRSLKGNTITVSENSSKQIKVRVAALENQPSNTWGCVEISAKKENCKSSGSSVVLSAWILDKESQE